ncbi:ferric reductase-like transmembrane domain-containing protein [Sulfitobacter sp. S190]|nr:ferric reductase-like transmembrane domain-containing protein [Sulfitobacter sp. S190]
MALLLLQPLLAVSALPPLKAQSARTLHRWSGVALLSCTILHILGLFITSPPDVVDALLLRSPTPFSVWGVIAMWAIFVSGFLAFFRLRLRHRVWRGAHLGLAITIVAATIMHAALIDGTMEPVTKIGFCIALGAVTVWVVVIKRGRVVRQKWANSRTE